MRSVWVLLALAVALTALSFSQTASQKTSQPAHPTASHGVLAIKSDTAGSILIDGQQRSDLVVGKIAVFNLMPGQHFVELRDATGSVLWKDVLSIPKGEQVVREIHAVQPTSTDAAGAQLISQPVQKSEPPAPIPPDPVLGDSPHAVATAIAQIAAAGRENFEPIKGQQFQPKIDPGGVKHWKVAVTVPGFECWLHETNITSFVGCESRQRRRRRQASFARALASGPTAGTRL
jgi:hypothetical protein